MILSPENYHSVEARKEYLSSSRYKDFCGSIGIVGCEARALAMQEGYWTEEPTPAMLVSSYVDCHFAGTMATFKAKNPKIFKKDGELRAVFLQANEIVARIERDPLFKHAMSGEKQVVMTAELFGAKWSIMIDSYLKDQAIVDLKIMAELTKTFWAKDYGHMSFVEYYGYREQAAIYQAVVRAVTGKTLNVYLAAASKEKYPDIALIGFEQKDLIDILSQIEKNIPRIIELKAGKVTAQRCEVCEYCRATKVLTEPIHFSELITKV